MRYYDNKAIAERLRALLDTEHEDDWDRLADRLGVNVLALHMSLDEIAPQPTVDVIAAVVAAYGVDPNWLLTGAYSSETHRSAAEQDRESVRRTIEALTDRDVRDSVRNLWLMPEEKKEA